MISMIGVTGPPNKNLQITAALCGPEAKDWVRVYSVSAKRVILKSPKVEPQHSTFTHGISQRLQTSMLSKNWEIPAGTSINIKSIP